MRSDGSLRTSRRRRLAFASTLAIRSTPAWTRCARSIEYADRLDYIHFKDIDARVLADVMGRRIRFFEACAEGVMCPIGRGMIDYPAIRAALARIDYQGFITVEQERDPRNAGGSLADVKASRDYLRSVGF